MTTNAPKFSALRLGRCADESHAHATRVAQRWDGLDARLQSKMAELASLDRSAEHQLLTRAFQATNATSRIFWLRQSADAATLEASKLAACRKGCNHCCHIAVVISRTEATVIAKQTGAKLRRGAGAYTGATMADPQALQEGIAKEHYGSPCPFLEGGACSIYESRPLACRWQINMDDDDLLCQLVADDGDAPKVPYLNLMSHQLAVAALLGENQSFDDIRNWFEQE